MADNSDDETLNNPINPQPENLPDEIISINETDTVIPKQETENMEVHAQELHKAPGHGWKHYFFEFFMLFLAVFCGFLAENWREQIVEHEREKQFIRSYVEDLKTDTASIRLVIDFRKQKMKLIDSLMLLLSTQTIKGHENELYYFGRQMQRTIWFQSNDRTIAQLKSSGSLRLIRNEDAADSIVSYQKLVDRISNNQNDERDERYNLFPLLSRMFNPFVLDKMVTAEGVNRPSGNPPLRSYDPNIQQDLAFGAHEIKGSTFLIETRLELLNEKAKNIIAFLKKEYQLE